MPDKDYDSAGLTLVPVSYESVVTQLFTATLNRSPSVEDIEFYVDFLRRHPLDEGIERLTSVLTRSDEFQLSRASSFIDALPANNTVRNNVEATWLLIQHGIPANDIPEFEVLTLEHPGWRSRVIQIQSQGRALHIGQHAWTRSVGTTDSITLVWDFGVTETFVYTNGRYKFDLAATKACSLATLADGDRAATKLQLRSKHDGIAYRVPGDLEVTMLVPKRVLLIGSCLLDNWQLMLEYIEPDCDYDRVLYNNIQELDPFPERLVSDYDFQIVMIPLRIILPEKSYFRLNYSDDEGYERLFADACARISLILPLVLRWNVDHKLLSFVGNFFVPQQNSMGRLLPRYSLKNPVHFFERINNYLVHELSRFQNVYLIDLDQISSNFGRKYIQDDAFCVESHGSLLSDWDHRFDAGRIEAIDPLSSFLTFKIEDFVASVWLELKSSLRTLRQVDQAKLVIIDLDDTLWRGVLAEKEEVDSTAIEGWPLGIAEGLLHLKRRGILLAIVSKNEESTVRGFWDELFNGRLDIEDFAFKAINWRPKTENIREIIRKANVLPTSVIFIDDNPVERAAVEESIKGVRVIGADPYYLKRILLWSAEMQLPVITKESASRTEMMQQQVVREQARDTMTRQQFLRSLSVSVEMIDIDSADHPSFNRALELLNKTNQFNTTGKRWTRGEFTRAMREGYDFHAFSVKDVYVSYGLVGLILISHDRIEQFVMSCRVFGLEIENAVLAHLVNRLRKNDNKQITGRLLSTSSNMPCRKLFPDNGFVTVGDIWVLEASRDVAAPGHIEFVDLGVADPVV
jgi:FkbH-like protein